MRINKEDILNNMSATEVYILILNGNIGKFPSNYWDKEDSKEKARECIRYLIDEVLKWSPKEILNNFTYDTFGKYKLSVMQRRCFHDSYHEAIMYSYPDTFQPWQFKNNPRNYWNENTFKNALEYVIKSKNMNRAEIKSKIKTGFFKEEGLTAGLKKCCNASPLEAVNLLSLDKFRATDFKKVPQGYWTLEHMIDEIIFVCEKRDRSVKDIINLWTRSFVEKNRLMTPINTLLDGDYVKALEMAYPNIYNINNINPDLKIKRFFENN